ncbi:MAG: hypothetical protein KDI71_22950, partial [Xanthomonadales bacterium]|nr:hypothetical protein [Xanthomonadales bacterium]
RGDAAANVSFVSTADKRFADELIETLGDVTSARSFVDFALGEATRSGFNVKTLRGLAQYVPFWQAQKGRAVLGHEPKQEQGAQDDDIQAQERLVATDKRARIQSYIDGLSEAEMGSLVADAKAQIEADHPPSAMTHRVMLDVTVRRLAEERLSKA